MMQRIGVVAAGAAAYSLLTKLARSTGLHSRTKAHRISPPKLGRNPILSIPASGIKSPDEVLLFWFTDAYFQTPTLLATSEFFGRRAKDLWYAGPSADASCIPFSSTLDAASRGDLIGPEWQTSEGMLAKIILYDQIARNIYRGTPKAFATDEQASRLSRSLVSLGVAHHFPPSAVTFIVSPLLHSEALADQDAALALIDRAKEKWTESIKMLNGSRSFVENHRDVIVKFGRFPHRNEAMGRKTSEAEERWLNSTECPGWAKSQKK